MLTNRVNGSIAKVQKIGLTIYCMLAVVFMSYFPAFATTAGAQQAIQDGIKDGTRSVYGILTAVVLPIAVVALAVCGFKLLYGDTKQAEAAKSTIIKIIIALAIVFLAPLFIEQIGSWFAGKADSTTIW